MYMYIYSASCKSVCYIYMYGKKTISRSAMSKQTEREKIDG